MSPGLFHIVIIDGAWHALEYEAQRWDEIDRVAIMRLRISSSVTFHAREDEVVDTVSVFS